MDFTARYLRVEPFRLLEWQQDEDGRIVRVELIATGTGTELHQTFDAVSPDRQTEERADWQAVLDRFARYAGERYGAKDGLGARIFSKPAS